MKSGRETIQKVKISKSKVFLQLTFPHPPDLGTRVVRVGTDSARGRRLH